MAIIARRDGIGALEPLVAVVDDEVLSTGLKATIMDRLSVAQILAVTKDSVLDVRVRLKRREAMVLAGSLGIQWGTNHRTWSRQHEQLRSNQVNEYMMRATRVQQHREIK